MNRIIRHIITWLTLVVFMFYTTGLIVEVSKCACSSYVEVKLPNATNGCTSCEIHSVQEENSSCCSTQETTSCSSIDASCNIHTSECCYEDIKYIKEDTEFAIANLLKVEEVFFPLIVTNYFDRVKKQVDINEFRDKLDPDIPIEQSKILLFYYHHNKVLPDNAHMFLS